MKYDLEQLNKTLREQFDNVENSPMVRTAAKLTENLRDTEVEDFIPEILGAMKIEISQYIWESFPKEVSDITNTMSDGILILYHSSRKFMTHDEALRYVVAAARTLSLQLT